MGNGAIRVSRRDLDELVGKEMFVMILSEDMIRKLARQEKRTCQGMLSEIIHYKPKEMEHFQLAPILRASRDDGGLVRREVRQYFGDYIFVPEQLQIAPGMRLVGKATKYNMITGEKIGVEQNMTLQILSVPQEKYYRKTVM